MPFDTHFLKLGIRNYSATFEPKFNQKTKNDSGFIFMKLIQTMIFGPLFLIFKRNVQ